MLAKSQNENYAVHLNFWNLKAKYLAPPFRPMVINTRGIAAAASLAWPPFVERAGDEATASPVFLLIVPADPKLDVKIKLEGWDVMVPQGTPIQMPKYSGSSFSQSEYLVYRESSGVATPGPGPGQLRSGPGQ